MANLISRIDAYQQRHPALAFPLAVFTKFSEDQAGSQAALIAYYAFLSIFPLLLVLLTVLQFIIGNNAVARAKILAAALSAFPAVGTQLQHNVHQLHGSTVALIIGLVLTLFGALGIANALQNAFNHVWRVPITERPNGPAMYIRSLFLIVDVGVGTIISSTLASYATGGHPSAVVRIGALLLGLAVNAMVFLFAFQVGTAASVKRRDLVAGAMLAAAAWMILQSVGSLLVLRQIQHMDALYGTFALVLGLLWWLFLQAQITVYAMEINVVKARKLWPRSLTMPPLTAEDKKAYTMYAKSEQRSPEEAVEVRFESSNGSTDENDAPALGKRHFIDAAVMLALTIPYAIYRRRKRK